MTDRQQHDPSPAPGARFATTQWTMVLAAGANSTGASRAALATLCAVYWYPLYAFVRRSGHAAADAEDLTQAFFAKLLEKNYLGEADRQRGKFRSFLLAAMQHFLSNQRDRARAAKRGGGRTLLSLDYAAGESRYAREGAHQLTPEKLYQQQWALALLERVLAQMREEYSAAGKDALYGALKSCLAAGHERPDYDELAATCRMTAGAVKVAAHRLRRRYRDRLRQEIAATVADPEAVEDEIRELFGAFTE